MPELTLTGMRVVYEVGARGSFTDAARALGYTQSGISRQVGLAERALGFELFERLPRGVRPTARGATLIRHIKSILERIDSAMLELEELGDPLSERLLLGAFPTALAALVPRALAQVRAEHPALDVRIREGGTEAQLRRLRAGRIAIGFTHPLVGTLRLRYSTFTVRDAEGLTLLVYHAAPGHTDALIALQALALKPEPACE
jgi:DNA-binding transcriptional LysR family regulator